MAVGCSGVQQLLDCRVAAWYPRFQRVAFKTLILPLPPPVVEWLVADGLSVPTDTQAFATRGPLDQHATEDDYREWSSDDASEDGTGSQGGAPPPPPPELAALRAALRDAIEQLGGRVVPKLTWSCPRDAVWLSPCASLCCANADEVLLLLRASDRVAHDVARALPDAAAADAAAAGQPHGAAPPAVQHCLALRRWHDLHPGREFRCFVRGHALVGASQRDVTQHYAFLHAERAELAAALRAFHGAHVSGRFPHPDFAYDVYVAASGAVRLLDFGPLGGTTAPLLFSWDELLGPAAAEAQPAAPQGSGSAEAAAAPPACCGEPAAAATGEAGRAAGEAAYLAQLRRLEALNLGAQSLGQQQQRRQQQPLPGEGEHGPPPTPPVPATAAVTLDLRLVEADAPMRPGAAAAYGVPFDFVDTSEGSALDGLLAQARAAGAGDLLQALRAAGGAAGTPS